MRLLATVAVTVAAALAVGVPSGVAGTACRPALVHYTPYPGRAPGLGRLPWVRATSRGLGLVALLWYWPADWRSGQVDRARIFTGGRAPGGGTTKILWAFLAPRARRAFRGGDLIVRARRLDGPGKTWQRFVSISYAGQGDAPSFASIVSLPSPGCWRVQLGAGGLHASVTFEAVPAP